MTTRMQKLLFIVMKAYHFIFIKELQYHRRWALLNRLNGPKNLDVTDNDSLVPGRADVLLHHTRAEGVPIERDDSVRIG